MTTVLDSRARGQWFPALGCLPARGETVGINLSFLLSEERLPLIRVYLLSLLKFLVRMHLPLN